VIARGGGVTRLRTPRGVEVDYVDPVLTAAIDAPAD